MMDAGMTIAPLGAPTGTPLGGWEVMTEANVQDLAKKLPRVTSGDSDVQADVGLLFIMIICPLGTVYTYLASGAGCAQSEGTFHALTHGFTYWASVSIDSFEVKIHNLLDVHTRSWMKSSMKQGSYHVCMLLQ